MTETKHLSDTQKMQVINDNNKLRKKWRALNKEQKLQILEGMEIALDQKWILSLFEELEND